MKKLLKTVVWVIVIFIGFPLLIGWLGHYGEQIAWENKMERRLRVMAIKIDHPELTYDQCVKIAN